MVIIWYICRRQKVHQFPFENCCYVDLTGNITTLKWYVDNICLIWERLYFVQNFIKIFDFIIIIEKYNKNSTFLQTFTFHNILDIMIFNLTFSNGLGLSVFNLEIAAITTFTFLSKHDVAYSSCIWGVTRYMYGISRSAMTVTYWLLFWFLNCRIWRMRHLTALWSDVP